MKKKEKKKIAKWLMKDLYIKQGIKTEGLINRIVDLIIAHLSRKGLLKDK